MIEESELGTPRPTEMIIEPLGFYPVESLILYGGVRERAGLT
jgi:hypothetical protein